MRNYLLFLTLAFCFCFAVHAQKPPHSNARSRSFEGIIKTVVLEDKSGTVRHYLDTGEESFPLVLEDENLRGAKVSITGRLNRENAVEIETLKVLQRASVKAENGVVTGARPVLVLLVNFQNHREQPATVDEVRRRIFTAPKSSKQYFRQASEERLRLEGRRQTDGDVFGYLTLPFTDENCTTDTVYNKWRRAADNLALRNGIDADLYQTVVYLFAAPSPGCASFPIFADLGVIGGQATERVFFTNAFSDFNNPQSDYFDYTMTHEIGHNLGLNHVSGYVDCSPNVPFEKCGDHEYADRSDVMGLFNHHLLSNYHRLRLGWLGGKVEKIDAPGIYYVYLKSPNQTTKGTTAAQIRLRNQDGTFTGRSLYLEYRHKRYPFDLFYEELLISPTVRNADKGVTIRVGNEDLQERLGRFFIVDTTPETLDFGDAPLLAGNTYSQFYYGINISTQSVNPFFGARVRIEILPDAARKP